MSSVDASQKIDQTALKPETFSKPYLIYALVALMGVNFFNYMDRAILSVLIEPIKNEFQASDTQMGLLTGLAFAVFYVVCGFPIARLADKGVRVKVIAVAIALWSARPVISGMAASYWQLLIARMGVGIGEAGGTPPSHSLIADYFPLEQRARAISFFVVGGTLGGASGILLAGVIGDAYGWRYAFFTLGAPGLVFALILGLTLKEAPRRGELKDQDSVLKSGNMLQASIHLFKGRAFTHIMIAIALLWFGNVGAGQWHAPFLQRSHDMSLSDVGLVLSVLVLPNLASILVGGYVADRLSKKDPIWLVYVPLISTLLSIPFLVGFYLAPVWSLAFVSIFFATLFAGAFAGVTLAAVQGLVGPHSRALAAAIMMFVSNLIGLGLGPFAVGFVSDLLQPVFGTESLRWALVLSKVLPLWAAYHLWLASKYFKQELRETTRSLEVG